ncbi:hypothetical protein G4G28_11415 [Massilia sp. Dwa41.01b]|uniref:T6SS immunity protein Tli4 family protein n=1 Tax=unclassified Massilia TaxID=2609279 RepID=UPI001600B9BB|nr:MULTISPECIES: T6SS immunity protein Tli4 family protein [unclassified Massilia]QNA88943.1 hypothetical protein G4G28_11415 [Massilia sp. Dwa41.01b]QNA99831.1 hypothetical protein G4G31_15050 [Massilia sp. Se16.2.3]
MIAPWLLALVVTASVLTVAARTSRTAEDVAEVSALTRQTKTVCVGRFLIDVPEQAQVRIEPAMVSGFDITRSNEVARSFAANLADREQVLAAKPNMLGKRNIESVTDVRGGEFTGKVFVHSRYRSYSIESEKRVYSDSVSVEGHVHKDGVTLSFAADTFDPAQTDLLPQLLARLVSRGDEENPDARGFCISGAFIQDSNKESRSESISMSARLSGHPDVDMVLWTNAASIKGPMLLARNAAAMDLLTRARSRTLREGSRVIHRMAGEEVALKVAEMNLATVYGFAWETRGTDDNVAVPHLSFEMDSGVNPRAGGKPVSSSLSEDAMLMLWGAISSSIRPRAQHD